ncbi:Oxidoreductase claN [Paramyrothecium foliicola]|nr:Oxidoreductase claN [Paramyrothecium foliicola]
MAPVWLITGASNGFGLLLSLRVLKAGHKVVGTVRSRTRAADAVKSIEEAGGSVIELDLTEPQESIHKKVSEAEAIYGQVDYLINNAGYCLLGPVELFTEREVKQQIQTNLFGPLFTIQAILPGMRKRRAGTIVNVSSVAGIDGAPSSGMYAASKHSLEGLSDGLAKEVAEFGISVLLIEPGAFRTNFLHGNATNERGVTEDWKDTVAHKALQRYDTVKGKQAGDPNKAVEYIFEVVTGEGKAGALKGKISRLILGPDAVTRVTGKLERVKHDLDACRDIATSTNIEE